MTIESIKKKLCEERNFGSRFPARIIFVENLDQYLELEKQLKSICDVTINVADFCLLPDTIPQLNRIKNKLLEYKDKQVLLLSIGEYLRICLGRELNRGHHQFRSFWETLQPETSKTRVIMPVFSCRDIFDRIIGCLDERQEDYVWTLDSRPEPGESYNLLVFSTEFKDIVKAQANNLTSWLGHWQTMLKKNLSCSIITSQYRYVEAAYSVINIKQFGSFFEYLKNILIDGNKLEKRWGDDNFWKELIHYVVQNYAPEKVAFKKIIFDELNINEFDFISIFARWRTLNSSQQNLVWIWYRMNPTDDYFSYACQKAKFASEIPEKIRDEILIAPKWGSNWLEERMNAVKAFSFSSFDDKYFALLDKLPIVVTKLKLLTFQTHEEKAYAVKLISGLLRSNKEPKEIAGLIENDYPSLASYLKDATGLDKDVDEYMAWYRKNKLINRYPGEFNKINFERFEARYKLMRPFQNEDCCSFWIDGFGIEYAPVFLYELKARGIIPESVEIALALLPTETEYNLQWDDKDSKTIKWDKLDSISHQGMPDDKSYYSCVANQLSVFAKAAEKVKELLENHEYVVVTGDHGSSRLAALAFHEKSVVPISAPQESKVRSFGRFCELDKNYENMNPLPGTVKGDYKGKKFLVMNNYQHFSGRGNAAGGNTDEHDVVGEIHGGNSAEERLVPVVVIKRKKPLPSIIYKTPSQYVEQFKGHIETTLTFNCPVSTLEISLDNKKATCKSNDERTWKVILDGVKKNEISLSIIANGRPLPKLRLKVKQLGISKNDDLFF